LTSNELYVVENAAGFQEFPVTVTRSKVWDSAWRMTIAFAKRAKTPTENSQRADSFGNFAFGAQEIGPLPWAPEFFIASPYSPNSRCRLIDRMKASNLMLTLSMQENMNQLPPEQFAPSLEWS
jgi:hypothetical protein